MREQTKEEALKELEYLDVVLSSQGPEDADIIFDLVESLDNRCTRHYIGPDNELIQCYTHEEKVNAIAFALAAIKETYAIVRKN